MLQLQCRGARGRRRPMEGDMPTDAGFLYSFQKTKLKEML